MRLLIAAGGTGGHIYPALAVARSLSASPEAPSCAGWAGTAASRRASSRRPASRCAAWPRDRCARSTSTSTPSSIRSGSRFSVPQATAILVEERPAAIFTTGGYVAMPVLMAAAPLRIPVVLWDGNVIPGRAVRATARLADALAVSFEADLPRRSRRRARPPVLRDRHADPRRVGDRPRGRPGRGWTSRPGERVLLIFGGSQAVRRFNAAVAEALPRLVERVTVIHVTGDEGYAAALAGREACPRRVRRRYRPYPFLRDEMLAALAAADLVVGRAGSSTLAEVTALGLPMVVVPYPHAAGHQRANAASLVEAGAARIVDDEAFDADALLDAAKLLDDPPAHAGMSAAARSLGRPGAADAVAELVLAAATGAAFPDAAGIERLARGAGA